MGSEDQKLQTKNQTGTRMKQTRKFKQCLRRSFYVLAIVCALFGLPTGQAATITVTNNADSGSGSLRQALADAHNEDTINFDSSLNGQTITLTSGELVVNKIVSINGPGPNNLAVDANHASRVFHVSDGASAGISGLSIINGSASGLYGGGIYNDHSTVSVINCTLSGNSGSFGGAIYARGDAYGSARLYLLHSTLSNSVSALSGGGGIYNRGALIQLSNTVFNASAIFNASGLIDSLGYNLSSDDGGGFLTATGDQINTNPMLGPLQDNGGPTFTHTLLSGSRAIDSGDLRFDPYAFSPPLLYDQRGDGFARVVNDRIDIGAFE